MGSSILLLASVVSTLGGLVFGYELGIISGALLQLKAEFGLSCVQQEALVSSLLIGALLASIVGGWLIDRHGRRNCILLSNVLILLGSLVLLVGSYSALLAGRILVGFAMCISSMSCCIFVSEIVTPDRRGFLVSLYETGITVGILAAYTMNYILSDCTRGWKWMFGLAIVPTLIQLLSIWFIPPGAEENVVGQREGSQSERDLMSSVENPEVEDSKASRKVEYSSSYLFQRKDNMRTRTLLGLGLVLFQQFTGQPNVLFYASTIFHSVGFQSDSSAVLASLGLGLVKVAATLTSMVFSDRAGRRPLLISGCAAMALCMITIGLLCGRSATDAKRPCDAGNVSANGTFLPHLSAPNGSALDSAFESQRLGNSVTPGGDVVLDNVGRTPLDSPLSASVHGAAVNWIILVCMMVVVSAYSVGFGPMTWLLLSEIFPAQIRGRAFAFTSCFNWAANLLVTCTFLNFIDAVGVSGMFLLYGTIAVAAGIFFFLVLPETKGKTLEEIDRELRSKRFYHSEECCGFIGWRKSSPQYQRVQCQAGAAGW